VTGTLANQMGQDGTAQVPFDASTIFTDVDGETLSFTSPDLPPWMSINPATGVITGTPPADASQGGPNSDGVYTVTVTATDPDGEEVSSTLTYTFTNPAPVVDMPVEDTPLIDGQTVSIPTDISDPDGDDLSYSATGLPAGLMIDPVTGKITGELDNSASQGGPNSDGVYTVTVTADDGEGGTVTDTFEINVTNPAPDAMDDTNTASEDGPAATGNVITNDSDPDGDDLIVTQVNGDSMAVGSEIVLPSGAALTLNADGTYDYDPNGAFENLAVGASTTDSFTYQISDGEGGFDTANVTITINGGSDGPTAQDDLLTVGENDTLLGEVLVDNGSGADSDIDGDVLTVTRVASGNDEAVLAGLADGANIGDPIMGSMGGTFTVLSNGTISFDPGADFDDLAVGETRQTQLVYQIDDGNGGTDTAIVTVRVDGENDLVQPVIPGQPNTPADRTDFLPDQSGTDNSPMTDLDLSDFFTDPDSSDTVTLVIDPADLPSGLTFDGTTISGTPDIDASQGGLNGDGVYTIPVTVTDSNGDTFVTELVYEIDNPTPIAQNDAFTTPEDVMVSGDLLMNDSDPDGDDLAIDMAALPDGTIIPLGVATDIPEGTLTVNADGTFTFDPADNFTGPVNFGYTVTDNEGGTDVATVTIDVTPVNDTPTVGMTLPDQEGVDSSEITALDTSPAFDDLDGEPLTFTAVNLPEGLMIDPMTGIISGTPAHDASQGGNDNLDGVYNVTVTATDPDGETASTDVTFAITNPAPEAMDDALSASEDDSAAMGNVFADNGSGADVDPDGDDLTVSEVNGVAGNVGMPIAGSNGGLITIDANGELVFDANAEFDDLDVGETATTTITYTIDDGEGGTDTATVTVTVQRALCSLMLTVKHLLIRRLIYQAGCLLILLQALSQARRLLMPHKAAQIVTVCTQLQSQRLTLTGKRSLQL